jgi:hypothetical protein
MSSSTRRAPRRSHRFSASRPATSRRGPAARERLREAFLTQHLAAADSPTCQSTRSEFGRYLRGSIGPRAHRKLRRHLVDCSNCSAALAEVEHVNSTMRSMVAPVVLGGTAVAARYFAAGKAPAVVAGVHAVGHGILHTKLTWVTAGLAACVTSALVYTNGTHAPAKPGANLPVQSQLTLDAPNGTDAAGASAGVGQAGPASTAAVPGTPNGGSTPRSAVPNAPNGPGGSTTGRTAPNTAPASNPGGASSTPATTPVTPDSPATTAATTPASTVPPPQRSAQVTATRTFTSRVSPNSTEPPRVRDCQEFCVSSTA